MVRSDITAHEPVVMGAAAVSTNERLPAPDPDQGMRLLNGLLAGTRDHVVIKDLAGRYLFVNPASAEWFGLPAGSVIGRTNTDLFGAAEAARIAEHDRPLLDRQPMEYEEQLTRDGIHRSWLTTKGAIRDHAGSVIGFGSISHEITDRVEAEQALELANDAIGRNERLLTAIADGVADHISIRDLEGRFMLVNRAVSEWYGMAPEAMVGRTLDELYPHNEMLDIAERDRRLLQSGEPMTFEETLTRHGRTRTWLTTRDVIRDQAGRIVATFAVSREITSLKRTEAQLRQAAKMEAVGQLAGGIAHDFNNLMTIVLGYADLMAETPDLPGGLLDDLGAVRDAAERASLLTRQLLAFSRQQMLRPRLVALDAVVGPIIPMLRRLLGEQIELAFVPGNGLGAVRVDPSQLEQVLMNLAINARDAMPSGGRLTVETTEVTLDPSPVDDPPELPAGRYVVLGVSDTGTGMTEAVRQRIFEPFYTTKEVGQGTGLGLATVYGIVTQSDGHILVESEPGHGSVFRVYLPSVETPPAGALSTPQPLPASSPRNPISKAILLVEDEPAVRSLMKTVLTRRGFRVLDAAHPQEALKMAERDHPEIDLLVTDVVMPGMTGPEMAERLLEWYPTMRVMYSSGYTERAVRGEDLIAAGATFLAKPFTPDELSRAVDEAFAASDPASP